jgi:hypothetical protein
MNRLNEHDIVTINLPALARPLRAPDFECAVIALSPSGAALEPLTDGAWLFPAAVEHVMLSFAYEGALIGLKGALSRGSEENLLRFSVEDGVQIPRRRTTRADVRLGVTVRPEGAAEGRRGTTINVAPDGLLAAVEVDADCGDLVDVSLELPEPSPPVETRARVVRHADGLIALEILPERRDARAQIGRFVIAHASSAWREQRRVAAGAIPAT